MNGQGDAANNSMVVDSEGPRIQARNDSVQRMLALGLEVSKRAAELRSLDDLYFFLVNDVRSLIEFDRCFLITHLGGRSRFAAANNQPSLETKSKLYEQIETLAPHLKKLDKGILLTNAAEQKDFPSDGVSEELKNALSSYVRNSQGNYFLFIPLLHNGSPASHMIFEFIGETAPDQFRVMALLNMAPLFASVLVEKWLLYKKPALAQILEPESKEKRSTV